MNRYWSSVVHRLTPYVPGEQSRQTGLVKLNTNENPYSPSPRALAAMEEEARESLRLYPDPNADRLKQALATCYRVRPEQTFVGNGSDEVLAHAFLGLLRHEQPLLFPDISYSFYPVYCGLYDIDYRQVPLNERFEIDPADYRHPNGGIIFPNPNAPTGRLLPLTSIREILDANPDSVVVVDEAYIDFGGESAIPLIASYPNLLVIQTLSKSRSLAGLRVGYAIGDSGLIEALERIKNSFNSYPLDRFAIAGAVAAIEDRDYFEQTRNRIIRTREDLARRLDEFGFEVLPSAANFLFVRHPGRDAGEISVQLREQSILVRHFRLPRIDQFLRITIGTEEQNDRLCQVLEKILG